MNTEKRVEELEMDVLDPLTGTLNKDSFYRKARAVLDKNPKVEYDFVTLDIENFKVINDLYGYEKGDNLLQYSAKCIQEACDSVGGICGRYFADIFMSIIPHTEGLMDTIVEMTFQNLDGGPIQPSPVIRLGAYPIKDRDLPVSAMYDRSMFALSSASGPEKVVYAIYDEKHRENALREQMILGSIDEAMSRGEVTIYLQPKYSLRSRKVNGAEALVRWISPNEGFILPSEFIPVLEKKGQVFKLDLFVWELTCKVIRKWIDLRMPIVPISVNVSRIDIDDPDFETALMNLIKKYDIPIEYFILEITETTYANFDERHMKAIADMRNLGFSVEMDDFGSGYSSLNMLKDFYIDGLKIDLGFLAEIGESARGEKILRLVVDLANDLDLGIIAEGVEEAHQADFLMGIGCQTAQGYYFAKPMPVSEFEKFLAEDQEEREK